MENSCEEARPIPPIASRALVVDAVWRNLPNVPKQVLRAEYPQYHSSGRAEFGRVGAARRMRMRLHEYEAALCVAADRVWNAFEVRR